MGGDVQSFLMNVPSCESESERSASFPNDRESGTSATGEHNDILSLDSRRSTDVLGPLPGSSEGSLDVRIAVNSAPALRRTNSGKLRSSSSGKHAVNKVLTRVPSDKWKEDGEEFRREEEKKRNENLQQAVMDFNDNDWTHTRLFFSHCW